ncbi:MAG: hypothetical protein GF381_00595 [Candidatus Pacebacteria bacterium]|nr:hypothetical protein [Candidatus Paceibacterota bacterium]
MKKTVNQVLETWSDDERSVAQNIIDKYGQPDGWSDQMLIWHDNGPWVLTQVTKRSTQHDFPMPHTDIVEQFVYFDVPEDKVDQLARYDGSVTVKRTEGLIGARCHDEPANFLAINLAHDIVVANLSVKQAKEKYLQSLKDFRLGKPTPYMEGLQFAVPTKAGDRGEQMITQEELESYRDDSPDK